MRRLTAFGLALALSVATALVLVSCGGDDAQLLPGETAREITANLDTVEQLASEGDCAGAEGAAEQVSAQVEALEGVDQELQRALRQGAARLNEVVADCEEATTEAVAPASVPETTESTSENEGKKEEKEREKEEKAAEKEEEREEEPATEPTGPPTEVPPPNSNGQGEGPTGEEEGAEEPSGGISPGGPAGEG